MAEVEEEEPVGLLPDGRLDLRKQRTLTALFETLFVADVGARVERDIPAEPLPAQPGEPSRANPSIVFSPFPWTLAAGQ